MWFKYHKSDGWFTGAVSRTRWQNLRPAFEQVNNPTDNRSQSKGQHVYDGTELRDATAQEIAAHSANRAVEDEAKDRRRLKQRIGNPQDHYYGRFVAALAVVLQEPNLVQELLDAIDAQA